MKLVKLMITTVMLMLLSQSILAVVSKYQKDQIIETADAISNASEKKDISGLMKQLTVDVVIEIGGSNKNPRSYTFQSYQQYLSKVFPLISDYKYRRFNESFISKHNGEYIYKFDLSEEYVFNNRKFKESHTEQWDLKYIGDSLRVYKIVIDK